MAEIEANKTPSDLVVEEFKQSIPPDIWRDQYDLEEWDRYVSNKFGRVLSPCSCDPKEILKLEPLLRTMSSDESFSFGIAEYELRDFRDNVRGIYFDKTSELPIESFTLDAFPPLSRRQIFTYSEEVSRYPSRSLGFFPAIFTKQTELKFEKAELVDVVTRRIVLADKRSGCGLRPFFLVSISSFEKTQFVPESDIYMWGEVARTYFQPGVDNWDKQITYTSDPLEKLRNPNPPDDFRRIAGDAEKLLFPKGLNF